MNLKLAIQKKGRLQEDSMKLLKESGLDFELGGREQLMINVKNFPLEIYLLRNSDIPQYLEDGVVDIAILGDNTIAEAVVDVQKIKPLHFGQCKLCLAIPKETPYTDIQFFQHKTIATSYPNTLKKFLKENNIEAKIHEINGSVELSIKMGLANAICDLVSTGSTLLSNGLKEVSCVLKSEVGLFAKQHLEAQQVDTLNALLFRMNSVLNAKQNKYILMNVPNDKIDQILRILPGMKSPTVLPLADATWSSVHTVIQKDNFWDIIQQLKLAGAEGILVIPIEQMIL